MSHVRSSRSEISIDYDFTGGQIINFYSLTLHVHYNSAVLVHFL